MEERLTIISETSRGESFLLAGANVSVGRGSDNDIVLRDASVSRRHCLLEHRDGRYRVSDLKSLNGTYVNGEPAAATLLSPGDDLRVGDFTLRFHTGELPFGTGGVSFEPTLTILPESSVRLRIDEVFGAMARDLTAILKISAKINSIRRPEELEAELLRQIFEVVPAGTGAIVLVDEDLEITETVGHRRDGTDAPVAVSRTVIGEVLDSRQVLFVEDMAGGEGGLADSESLALAEISTLLCVPVVLFERTLGAIYLSASDTNFDEGHLRFLTGIAGIAAVAIENARNFAFLESENRRLRGERFDQVMLGESPPMKKIFELIERVAPTETTVLITGESGTGKELAAQSIHLNSRRREGPFVAVNCAALTENLLESELFGHEKGAFTGAVARKQGKIETAAGGTLFLDEIGEIPLNLQARLLRFLQEREFERVGGTRPMKADVRLVAATNRDLRAEVGKGGFREDLFYRLNVVELRMPSLRERGDDILLLAESFIGSFAREINRPVRGLSAAARKVLLKYDFGGNVRELKNIIERAVVLGAGDWILPEDLPEDLPATPSEQSSGGEPDFQEAVREKKRELILEAFRRADGSYVETARLLGLNPNYLHRLIRNLEMKEELEESDR